MQSSKSSNIPWLSPVLVLFCVSIFFVSIPSMLHCRVSWTQHTHPDDPDVPHVTSSLMFHGFRIQPPRSASAMAVAFARSLQQDRAGLLRSLSSTQFYRTKEVGSSWYLLESFQPLQNGKTFDMPLVFPDS